MDKFSLKRDKYSVRLMMQFTPNSNSDQNLSSDANFTVDETDLFNSHCSKMNTSSDTRGSTRRTRSSVSSSVTQTMNNNIEMDDNPVDADMNGSFEVENYQVTPLQIGR